MESNMRIEKEIMGILYLISQKNNECIRVVAKEGSKLNKNTP
jgi:hypothetical protein